MDIECICKIDEMRPFQLNTRIAHRTSPRIRVRSRVENISDGVHRDKGKGQNDRSPKRRRGRPAHLQSSLDTPLRDGNRDRLIGLLTKR